MATTLKPVTHQIPTWFLEMLFPFKPVCPYGDPEEEGGPFTTDHKVNCGAEGQNMALLQS